MVVAMDYEGLLDLVKKRRTVRDIKPDQIPDEKILKILEVARWAPSGFNMQPWEFVVVKDEKLKAGIQEIVDQYRLNDFFQMEATREPWQGPIWAPKTPDEFRLAKVPVYIVVLGDTRLQAGLPMAARYCQQKLCSIWESTLADAVLYIHLAATALGLASHWVSAVKMPRVQCLIKDLLGVPHQFQIYEIIGLGYPAKKPQPRPVRELKEMIHYDRVSEKDFRSDDQVRETIKELRLGTVTRHL